LQAQQTIELVEKEPCTISAIEREPTEHREYWTNSDTPHQGWRSKTGKNRAIFAGSDSNYIPQLYLPNPDWNPSLAHTAIKHYALMKFVNHPLFIILHADKNMGVVIMCRHNYMKQAVEEHLKTPAYHQISASQAKTSILHLRYKYLAFVSMHSKSALGEEVARFMMRGYTLYGDSVAKFCFTVKVHKQPVMLRPVVSKVGTYIECVSKWLDYTLLVANYGVITA
jgi:hypothetical protein